MFHPSTSGLVNKNAEHFTLHITGLLFIVPFCNFCSSRSCILRQVSVSVVPNNFILISLFLAFCSLDNLPYSFFYIGAMPKQLPGMNLPRSQRSQKPVGTILIFEFWNFHGLFIETFRDEKTLSGQPCELLWPRPEGSRARGIPGQRVDSIPKTWIENILLCLKLLCVQVYWSCKNNHKTFLELKKCAS